MLKSAKKLTAIKENSHSLSTHTHAQHGVSSRLCLHFVPATRQ